MAIITISRGTYSGGKSVAEAVGKRLGYPCISKEIISDASEEFGVPEEELIAVFEKPLKSWRQKYTKRLAHLNFIRYALLKRAKNDDLVYQGYIGHLLLHGISHVIRVRIIADIGFRMRAAMSEHNITRKQAVSMIAKLDKQNSKWTQFLYGVEWHDPSLYDVVINLEHMDIKSAVKIIKELTDLDDFQPTENSRDVFTNQLISSQVWAALTKNKLTASANVHVITSNGSVTISGNASSERALDAIQAIAMQVEGVEQVQNEVNIGSDWHW